MRFNRFEIGAPVIVISFLVGVLLLYTVGCCMERDEDDEAGSPTFYAQMSNAHIAGCNATGKNVYDYREQRRISVWSIRCVDGRRFSCSVNRLRGGVTQCSIQNGAS